MKKILFGAMLLGAVTHAQADLTVTITQNTTLGGTDWTFSGGTGGFGVSVSSAFLVGETLANPQPFKAGGLQSDTSLTVLAGTNVYGIQRIYSHSYGGLSGTNGSILDGLDFQTFIQIPGSPSLSAFNGLVLNANSIAFSGFNPGTYVMNSYYTGYGTNLGMFTLNVVSVPEPETYAMLVAGLGLLGFAARRRKLMEAATA